MWTSSSSLSKTAYSLPPGYVSTTGSISLVLNSPYVADAAGQYSVLRLRDPEKFATLLEVLQNKYGFRYEQRELHGQTYAHLTFPDIEEIVAYAYPELRAKMGATPVERLWWRLFAFVPGHLYWKMDGQYLIFAQIPQVLVDRDRIATKTPIKSWLKDVQKLPGDDAFFIASSPGRGHPQADLYGVPAGPAKASATWPGNRSTCLLSLLPWRSSCLNVAATG